MAKAVLNGKRFLVVGGETALGRALVVGLAEAGADVAIASLSPETKAEFEINSALNELWAMGRHGLALAIDASDAAQVRAAAANAEQELGRLDLAAAIAENETAVALDALREALDGREVAVFAPDVDPADALRSTMDRF